MQTWVVICWAIFAVVGADECPDGGRCAEGQTCCSSPTNGYGCCPFDQAECCEDHIHCCPADTICDSEASRCVNATVSIPWMERSSALQRTVSKSFRMIKSYMGEDDDNICPDQSRCPAEFSCLKALTKFGCCPLAKGISCSDGKHCCPEGHHCSIDSRSCIKKELVTAVQCSDGVSECPDETTCCETPEGKWGCCPMPKAVCCDDKKHCCPEGTTCNIEQMKCISISTKKELPMWAKFPARQRAAWENQNEGEEITAKAADEKEAEKSTEAATANQLSPLKEEVTVSSVAKADGVYNVACNETAACPDGTTCCKTKEGGWACCPLTEAVCCEDFIHCCPKGKKCNVAAGTCEDGLLSIHWFEKKPAIFRPGVEVQVKNVPCNDTAACPDGTTCCKTKEGGWACCPLIEAVCCEDFIHCCPKGKTCNVAAGTCEDGLLSIPWFEKKPAISRPGVEVQVKNVPCNDTAACPDGTTCCKTKEGGWACCPLIEAVCCEDFIHCCPKGKKCNVAAGTCEDGLLSIPWFEKKPAISRPGVEVQVKNVPCNDTAACPDGTTCCKTKEGGWACCPLIEAVCCDDFIHCCPKGKTCNVAAGTCEDGLLSIPWFEKKPAISRPGVEVKVKNVPCNDTAACPDGTTCCKTKEGGWACCPLIEAVCCDDFIHCCPKGKTCNVAAGTCEDGLLSIPWFEKKPAISRPGVEVKVKNVPCNDTAACPDGTTCCKTKEGGWACCPLPKAVCCDDHEHCCPEGTTCNPTSTGCLQASASTPFILQVAAFTTPVPTTTTQSLVTTPAETSEEDERPTQEGDNEEEEEEKEEEGNQCDEHTSCPRDTTCCFMQSCKKWGCCPLPKAVCCADGNHCCPENYKCNEDKTTCVRGEVEIPWYTKLPAITSVQVDPNNVQCGDDHQCPERTSCCKLFTGEWGCCPLQNAVCCSDKEHCCPQGYTCDVLSNSCQKLILLQLETLPLIPVFLPEHRLQFAPLKHRDVQCDAQKSCPDNNTCCRTSATTWGCCPAPHAVCCSDMKHCCPSGFTCTEEGSCEQNSGLNWQTWDMFSTNKKRALIL
ncbi:granulins-like [Xiphophorus maculatus]|uniref:granulins-like n=1 Tax=Xiphophorus maculatus TaxID=8083 RepID=UPI000C6DAFDF|nr:granulins-like [Xiphophorus maculatus]